NEALSGHGSLTIQDQRWNIDTLQVNAGQAHLAMNGCVDDAWHLQWSAHVPNLHKLLKNTQGRLKTDGLILGKRENPTMNANLGLNDFFIKKLKIAKLMAEVKPDNTFSLKANMPTAAIN